MNINLYVTHRLAAAFFFYKNYKNKEEFKEFFSIGFF